MHVNFSDDHSIQFSENFDDPTNFALVITCDDFDHVALGNRPVSEGHLKWFRGVLFREVVCPLGFVEVAGYRA